MDIIAAQCVIKARLTVQLDFPKRRKPRPKNILQPKRTNPGYLHLNTRVGSSTIK